MAGADDSGLGVSRMNTIIALVSFKLKTSITIMNNMQFHLTVLVLWYGSNSNVL